MARSACWRMARAPNGRVTNLVKEKGMGGADTLAGRVANLLQARA